MVAKKSPAQTPAQDTSAPDPITLRLEELFVCRDIEGNSGNIEGEVSSHCVMLLKPTGAFTELTGITNAVAATITYVEANNMASAHFVATAGEYTFKFLDAKVIAPAYAAIALATTALTQRDWNNPTEKSPILSFAEKFKATVGDVDWVIRQVIDLMGAVQIERNGYPSSLGLAYVVGALTTLKQMEALVQSFSMIDWPKVSAAGDEHSLRAIMSIIEQMVTQQKQQLLPGLGVVPHSVQGWNGTPSGYFNGGVPGYDNRGYGNAFGPGGPGAPRRPYGSGQY